MWNKQLAGGVGTKLGEVSVPLVTSQRGDFFFLQNCVFYHISQNTTDLKIG